MAARKHKAKPRGASRTPSAPARKSVPGWIWLASGAAIGGFLVFLAQLEPGRDEVKRTPQAKPPVAASQPAPQPPRPKYEFYEELTKSSPPPLPGSQPTPEQLQASEAARAQALLEGRTPPPRMVVAPSPTPPASTPAPTAAPPSQSTTAAAQTKAQTPPASPATPAKPATEANNRYYLQAGAFGSREQAESARARLILLGQDARVESGAVGGKTVHRVVVGPFSNRQQADGAQRLLGNNGVSSVVQQRR